MNNSNLKANNLRDYEGLIMKSNETLQPKYYPKTL